MRSVDALASAVGSALARFLLPEGALTGVIYSSRPRPVQKGPLACRFLSVPDGPGGLPCTGVELQNTGDEEIVIRYYVMPFQFLDLLIVCREGVKVPQPMYRYGVSFKGPELRHTLTLRPNEKYSHTVDVSWPMRIPRLRAGTYTILAVFEMGDLTAVSAPLEVVWPGRD